MFDIKLCLCLWSRNQMGFKKYPIYCMTTYGIPNLITSNKNPVVFTQLLMRPCIVPEENMLSVFLMNLLCLFVSPISTDNQSAKKLAKNGVYFGSQWSSGSATFTDLQFMKAHHEVVLEKGPIYINPAYNMNHNYFCLFNLISVCWINQHKFIFASLPNFVCVFINSYRISSW